VGASAQRQARTPHCRALLGAGAVAGALEFLYLAWQGHCESPSTRLQTPRSCAQDPHETFPRDRPGRYRVWPRGVSHGGAKTALVSGRWNTLHFSLLRLVQDVSKPTIAPQDRELNNLQN